MQLFAVAKLSPYASRPRMAVYAWDLPVEIAAAPGDGGPHHPDYLKINPIGKLPALLLDDGSVVAESDAIVEYFADKFPDKPMRAETPEARARGRVLARIAELYVLEGAVKLFSQMDMTTRTWSVAKMDPKVVGDAFAHVDKHLENLDWFLTGQTRCAVADTLTTADCAIVPVLGFIAPFAKALGREGFLERHEKAAAYWASVQSEPAAARITEEMAGALGDRIKA
ncbi:MAG TPA: glutathione S-transferase family protein [Caulobacteraceae bacterium]|jgi:glutathione S-transferase|nr:glutathione S-transferase family protein [Caulobacteraceae bacterium]